MEYVKCVCVWLGAALVERGWVDERIGFGLYQSCGNRGNDGSVSVFGLLLFGWCRWDVGRVLDQGLEGWGGGMSV